MAQFRRNPYKHLDDDYDFVGGMDGLRNFALESGVQPVHDLGRLADWSTGMAGQSGFYTQIDVQAHVANGTIRDTTEPWSFISNFSGFEDATRSVWLMGVWATNNDPGDLGTVSISLSIPARSEDGNVILSAAQLLIGHWDASVAVTPIADGVFPMLNAALANPVSRLPMWIPNGSVLNHASTSDNLGTVNVTTVALLWAGAWGAKPPGV